MICNSVFAKILCLSRNKRHKFNILSYMPVSDVSIIIIVIRTHAVYSGRYGCDTHWLVYARDRIIFGVADD